MNKRFKRAISVILSLCLVCSIFSFQAEALAPPKGLDYLNTYENTGDQRKDIIGVALTQFGYTEIVGNDTKFGNWYGLPGGAWCAMFLTWCARQADIPETVFKRAHNADPNKFGVANYYKGTEYTPQPGDLFFTPEKSHVGLVYYVKGEYFYTLEGNTENFENGTFCVMSKERLIEEFCFGTINYEGGDKDHDYVKKQESAHPHKTYYECTICGDINYTGYDECVISCSSCITCGCSTSYAGYYKFKDTDYGWKKIRKNHSSSGESVGCASNGEVLYVYAASPSSDLAYINYDGIRGHIPFSSLTKYNDPPASPTITSDKIDYIQGESVSLNWNIPANTEQIRLSIYKNNEEIIHEEKLGLNTEYILKDITEGSYKAEIIACNLSGVSKKSVTEFSVRNLYYLNYDAKGGSGAPETQTQVVGEKVTVGESVPTLEGYQFLGWTQNAESTIAEYYSGDEIISYRDMVLYAVWMQNDAILSSIEVYTEPNQKYYLIGEELNLTGLKVKLNYSDGVSQIVSDGYEVSGFDSAELGVKTVNIAIGEISTSFEVEVMEYIPGDIDLNKAVNRDDVMALLWHITFPEEFPVTVPADFTSDAQVNRDDVMALLWHITFPEEFPLSIN